MSVHCRFLGCRNLVPSCSVVKAQRSRPEMKGSVMHASQITAAHPDVGGDINEALLRCLEACQSCAQACTACADACLAEPMVAELRQCIRLNLDCADMCTAAGNLASRRTGSHERGLVAALEACARACARSEEHTCVIT